MHFFSFFKYRVLKSYAKIKMRPEATFNILHKISIGFELVPITTLKHGISVLSCSTILYFPLSFLFLCFLPKAFFQVLVNDAVFCIESPDSQQSNLFYFLIWFSRFYLISTIIILGGGWCPIYQEQYVWSLLINKRPNAAS